MAKTRMVIEDFPPDLLQELKIRAVREGTSLKAVLIQAAEKLLGRKAGTK